jgi:ubiquinone/menaquinone biosynthesis C-methylase UbiE
MTTPREQFPKIVGAIKGLRATYLAAAGVNLGLFEKILAAPGITAAQLAADLGLHPPYVLTWCRTAHALGFLDADEEGRLRLAPGFEPILAEPASPWYYGGALGLTVEYETDDLRRLPEIFRSGAVVPFQARGRKFSEQVGAATAGLHTLVARKLLPEVPGLGDWLSRGAKALDVGCGCGGFLVALARAFPGGRYTGVDVDRRALTSARKAIKAAGFARRVKVKPIGADGFPVKGPFDLVTLVQVFHEIRSDLRPAVLGECRRVIAPDGWFVILDETYPSTWAELRAPENSRPVLTALSELSMGNVIPTREEQEALLAGAGFAIQSRAAVGDGFTLLTARPK